MTSPRESVDVPRSRREDGLPEGWEWRTIESLGKKIKAGGTPSRSVSRYWNGEIPFVKIEDVTRSGGFLTGAAETITEEGLAKSSAWLVPDNSILLTMYGTIGVPAITTIPLATNQAILAIEPNKEIDPLYLMYALWKWGPDMIHLNVQSAQKNIGAGIVKSFSIPIAPFEEQRVIAHVVRSVQKAKEETADVIEAVRQLRSSALRHFFSAAFLDDCALLPLGEAATWLSGGTPKTSEERFWGGDIPWITSSSLTTFRLQDSVRRLTPEGVENGSRLIPAGTTLCVVRGMSLRTEFRVGIAEREMAFGQDCKALIPNEDDFLPVFFAYAVKAKSNEVLERVDRAGHGTGRLATDALKSVVIPAPPKQIQEEVVEALTAIDNKLQAEELRLSGLEQLFKTLLHELMTGKARVGDQLRVA